MINDEKIYMTKKELADSTGRKESDVSNEEYEKYISWTSQRW